MVTMTAVIELAALTKRYGATVGIQGLDLRVEAGEVFGFLGSNGAGKTTTIRSSHVLSEVQRACRRVAIVRAGRLVAVEAVAALREARVQRLRLSFLTAMTTAWSRWSLLA